MIIVVMNATQAQTYIRTYKSFYVIMTRGNSENRQVFARMQGMELPVLRAGLISFIHVLSEIANELIAAASGACIC